MDYPPGRRNGIERGSPAGTKGPFEVGRQIPETGQLVVGFSPPPSDCPAPAGQTQPCTRPQGNVHPCPGCSWPPPPPSHVLCSCQAGPPRLWLCLHTHGSVPALSLCPPKLCSLPGQAQGQSPDTIHAPAPPHPAPAPAPTHMGAMEAPPFCFSRPGTSGRQKIQAPHLILQPTKLDTPWLQDI